MSRTDVQGTLRDMWETRPSRPRQDRQVAGVAAGIARRYDIDPVLVRVAFVVAAFFGIGAALYIAGWIMLPEEPTDPSAPTKARSPRAIAVVGLAIATAVTVGAVFGGDGGFLLPTLAAFGLLFLLHHSRADRGPVGRSVSDPTADAPTVATASPVNLRKEPGAEVTPPSWDPLGAAPFAWDLPEPAPVPPGPPPPRRLPVTPVTLGLALLAGGVTAVVLLLAGAMSPANLPLLFGVVLAVLGSGLVVGAFVRSGRGLIPIALLLGALTWAVIAAPIDRWEQDGFGELRVAPTTVSGLQPVYRLGAGDVDIDLRGLDLSVPGGGPGVPVRSRIELGAGDIEVRVPADADLTLTGSVGVGQMSYEGQDEDSGFGEEVRVVDDLGEDGVRSGRPLVLDISSGAGDVEVRRG